jgi:chemotaxis response regulator CheB
MFSRESFMTNREGLTFVISSDYPTARKLLKALLEGNGFRVLGEATNVDEALRMAGELKPDKPFWMFPCRPRMDSGLRGRSKSIIHTSR